MDVVCRDPSGVCRLHHLSSQSQHCCCNRLALVNCLSPGAFDGKTDDRQLDALQRSQARAGRRHSLASCCLLAVDLAAPRGTTRTRSSPAPRPSRGCVMKSRSPNSYIYYWKIRPRARRSHARTVRSPRARRPRRTYGRVRGARPRTHAKIRATEYTDRLIKGRRG